MNSVIFDSVLATAQKQAQRLLGSKTRLIVLLSQLGIKFARVEEKGRWVGQAKEALLVFWRLIKAFAAGHYRALSWKAMVGILVAIIYFINPADVIPDFVPVSGLIDDFSILVWTYSAFQSELEKFLTWEQDQRSPIR